MNHNPRYGSGKYLEWVEILTIIVADSAIIAALVASLAALIWWAL